jgi:hypothetical protein
VAIFASARQDRGPQIRETRKSEMTDMTAKMVPQLATCFQLLEYGLEQRATRLLNLIDRKCKKHQQHQHRRKVLFAVTIVMFVVVALVLERVKRLILDPPT